jgi:L-fuculose-phosphate aldolase
VEIGHKLAANNLVHASSGNISARADRGLLMTPAGARLDSLRPSELVLLDDVDSTPRLATSELEMHVAIYSARPDVGAVVHTHSPYATAWSCAAAELTLLLEEATYYGMRSEVRVAPYARAGSRQLAHHAVAGLADGPAVLLERHGAVAVGPDPGSALCIAESLEHQAHVAWLLGNHASRAHVGKAT